MLPKGIKLPPMGKRASPCSMTLPIKTFCEALAKSTVINVDLHRSFRHCSVCECEYKSKETTTALTSRYGKFDNAGMVAEGVQSEKMFYDLLERGGVHHKAASRKQNMLDHVDVYVCDIDDGSSVGIEIKGLKAGRTGWPRTDASFWIELVGNSGQPGWLFGKATYIATRVSNSSFAIINRKALADYIGVSYEDAKSEPADRMYDLAKQTSGVIPSRRDAIITNSGGTWHHRRLVYLPMTEVLEHAGVTLWGDDSIETDKRDKRVRDSEINEALESFLSTAAATRAKESELAELHRS